MKTTEKDENMLQSRRQKIINKSQNFDSDKNGGTCISSPGEANTHLSSVFKAILN